jgi:adenosylmethionine-8-amino-7-oxononanoate aminotransferase
MLVYPKEYLDGVAKLAKKYSVHLILDEVAVGFGRTGKMFACEYVKDIEPDFLCLSKGITAGYLPMAATLTTDKIYQAFYADYQKKKTFFHGHTYTANPLACSAAIASLKVFKEEKVLKRIKNIIPKFHESMDGFRNLEFAGNVRCLGLIGAIELVKDKKTKEGFGLKRRIGLEVYKRGLKRNIILRPLGDIIYLFLPLCIKEGELKDILKRTRSVIESVRKEKG